MGETVSEFSAFNFVLYYIFYIFSKLFVLYFETVFCTSRERANSRITSLIIYLAF